MVGKIIYSDAFISQLDELSRILFIKKYFSFIENVDFYIDKIYESALKDDFDKRFAKGLILEESKKRTYNFIRSLPWKEHQK